MKRIVLLNHGGDINQIKYGMELNTYAECYSVKCIKRMTWLIWKNYTDIVVKLIAWIKQDITILTLNHI